MKQGILKSAPLLCGAILASICVVAEPVEAIPTLFTVHSDTGGGSSVTVPHTFGTQGQNIASTFYPIFVSSGPSQRIGWQYEISFDFSQYDIGFFGGAPQNIDLLDIKPPGSPDPITTFFVKKADGSPYTTTNGNIIGPGTGVHVTVSSTEILNAPGQVLIIQWNQTVPAPGALALLGMAGVAGARRRRRS